jgi:hypothetical protein
MVAPRARGPKAKHIALEGSQFHWLTSLMVAVFDMLGMLLLLINELGLTVAVFGFSTC